jgi:hypothetical protein
LVSLSLILDFGGKKGIGWLKREGNNGEGTEDKQGGEPGREALTFPFRKLQESSPEFCPAAPSVRTPSIRPDAQCLLPECSSVFTTFHHLNHLESFTKVVPKTLICLGNQFSPSSISSIAHFLWRHQETPRGKPWKTWKLKE